MKTTRFIWYIVGIGVFILFMLILVSSIINIGEKLASIHEIVSYVFYGLCVVLVYFLIINPLRIILFSPSFNLRTTLDKDTRKNRATYKKVAKRLLKNSSINEEEKEALKNSISDSESLRKSLNHTYNHYIKKEINKEIRKHAKTVMISTAISQSGRFDAITVFVVNLRLIKQIVALCGFRPSFKNLSKLSINIFMTALIAEGLENLNINELLPSSAMNVLSEIPFIKPMLSSVTQGIANALLTLRVGIITRKYLFSDSLDLMNRNDIRRGALLESIKMLPSVVGSGIASLPKKFFSLFRKNTDDEETKSI